MNNLHAAARHLHTHGINVIPVRADGSKAPALRAWQNHQTTLDDIDEWFGTGSHTALGIVTGPPSGNLELTEIEGPYTHRVPELAALAEQSGLGDLWNTLNAGWVERSPSGGAHWMYRVTGDPIPGNTKLAQGAPQIDAAGKRSTPTIAETRGRGGQVVAAPTGGHAHASGRPWELLAGGPATVPTITPEEREAFHTLLGTLDEREQTKATGTTGGFTGILAQAERTHQARQLTLDGTSPGDDFEAKTTWAQLLEPAGWRQLFTRGRTTYWTRPGKSTGISATTGSAEDRDRLYVFSSSTEFPTFEPITKFSAYATLEHGGDHSAAATRLKGDGYGEERHVKIATPAPAPGTPLVAPAPQPTTETIGSNVLQLPTPEQRPALQVVTHTLDLTDDANANELIQQYGDRLRYNADQGRWLTWNGHRWDTQANHGGYARELAKATARTLGEGGADASKALKHKRYSLSERGITAMLNTARTDPSISVNTDDLDAHPLELNTPAGIVDLTTGTITPPDPTRLHTRATTVAPDATADTNLWDTFLAATFPDEQVRGYIKRLAGHSILGEVRAHVLPFAHGSGGNGKGVFLEAIRGILGGYAGSAPAGFLMSSHYQQHATELADLAGRRFVICTEVNPTDRFDEAKVKALTGGDTVKARFMRQDFFEFRPTHHLWLMGNDQPAVDSGGKSFWRRLRLIPFTHEIPEEQQIEDLQGILAREHGPAILHWLIEGAVEYLRDGMQEPETVKAATTAYSENVDTIGRFLEDECLLNASLAFPVSKIRAAYESWCQDNGERPQTGRAFSSQLARHGVQVGRDAPKGPGGARMYGGIALVTREEEPVAAHDGDRGGF